MKDAKEKVMGFLGKVKESLKKVSKKVWIIIAAVLVVLIVAIAVMLTLNKKEYAVLVTQVSNTEASTILNFLSNQGVTDYKVEDGNTILVPQNQETALKAQILMQNLNQTGSYYMENLSTFSTNEERDIANRLDLQDRMEAVIRNFPNVIDADVNITPGENRAYILDSNNVVKASAAVMLTMAEGTMLTDEQAQSIQSYVTHSVQGLEIESVSIGDTNGNIYLTKDALSGEASAIKLQIQQTVENHIRTQVLHVLTPFFGEDNVKVGVTCEVDVDRTTERGTVIDLPDYAKDGSTNGRGIISSEQGSYYVTRPGEGLPGGLVGTESNSDLQEQVEAAATPQANDTSLGGSHQTDYENSRREYETDNNGAVKITDCTLAISINARAAGEDLDVDLFRQLAAKAAGIRGEVNPITGEEYLEDKISIVSMNFFDPNTGTQPGITGEDGLRVPLWVLIAAGVGLLLFTILLTALLLMRRKKRKKQEEEEERQRLEMEALAAAAGLTGEDGEPEGGADVMDLEMERGMELRKDIRQFASENPEIAAQMLKGWLRGGDDNG